MSFILSKYQNQYNSMRSYETVRDLLYTNQLSKIENVPKPIIKKDKPVKVRKTKTQIELGDESVIPEYDDNVILAINNDINFGIIISNFRKQKCPMAHLYYNENISSLICFIKNPRGYPIIIVTIPNNKQKNNIYVNRAYVNSNMCYMLPLNDDIFKNVAQNKVYSYSIIFSQCQGMIKFRYRAKMGNAQPVEHEINNIDEIDLTRQINTDFSFGVDALSQLLDDENYNAMNQFDTMTLNIVCKQTEPDNFNLNDTSKSKNIISITFDKTLLYSVLTTTGNKRVILCNGNDQLNLIRWNLMFNGIEPDENGNYNFELFDFTSLFKSSYGKILHGNVNVYYIFGQYHDDVYIFGKVTTTQLLDQSNITNYTVKGLFYDEFSTKEVYMCKTTNIFKTSA